MKDADRIKIADEAARRVAIRLRVHVDPHEIFWPIYHAIRDHDERKRINWPFRFRGFWSRVWTR